jgi:hypothetical protein
MAFRYIIIDKAESRIPRFHNLSQIVKRPSYQVIKTYNIILERLRKKVNAEIRPNKTGPTGNNNCFLTHII